MTTMTEQEAIRVLRDAVKKMTNYCADVYANAKLRGAEAAHPIAYVMAKLGKEAIAATATIQPVAEPEPVRDQIIADARCIIRLLDTVDKLVGGASGATESIQEHSQHILKFAEKITAAPAQATPDAQYKAQRDRLLDFIKNAQVSSGVCMCGSSVEGHGFGDGHSPVDVWDYSVMKLIEEIEAQDATTTTQAAPPAASQTGEGDAY